MTVGLPDSIRPQLRALVAGVVATAQDVYRRRLAVVSGALGDPTTEKSHSLTIGDQWPHILEVLNRHLKDQPELLDRVLLELANTRPVQLRPPSSQASSA